MIYSAQDNRGALWEINNDSYKKVVNEILYRTKLILFQIESASCTHLSNPTSRRWRWHPYRSWDPAACHGHDTRRSCSRLWWSTWCVWERAHIYVYSFMNRRGGSLRGCTVRSQAMRRIDIHHHRQTVFPRTRYSFLRRRYREVTGMLESGIG